MEGLEVTVLPVKEALSLDETGRIDAGYFSKDQIRVRKLAETWEPLGDCCEAVACGPFGSTILDTNYVEDGVPMIRPFNLREMRSDAGDIVNLSEEFVAEQQLKLFKRGDLMFARVGDVGCSALVQTRATISPNIIAASLKAATLNPFYVAVFFNTAYGMLQMQGAMKVVAQPTISTDLIRKLKVPKLTDPIQRAVGKAFAESESLLLRSREAQGAAEQTLLRALGLEGWEPPEPLTYTRRASEALAAARFDAEHFRPKFAALLAKMKEHGQVVRLGDCVRFCERGRQPQYAEEGLPVINSRHVRANNVVLDEDNRFATEDPAQLRLDEEDRFTIKQSDLLINGTGVGTMGRCAPYLREDKALPDNHVTILRMKPETGLEPVFLSVQLNSLIGRMQVEQYFKGSSGQIELYPSEIKEFRIWLAPPKIQQQIKSHLEQAHHSRQEAQALLAKAKRAVEVAIEEGEVNAMKLLS